MGTAGLTSARLLAHRVDITLSDGRRVVVEGSTALSSVVGLVQGLMA
ncbi:oxidoreductase [Pelagivirga sediminicola]|uniref:Oxidoreductase n=2 Tax=Pelagivirga sediminicola TaxID=2170575 RepID=A0A2T7G3M3_9RHOB|nr:oxidoreductase [Pelagivirga sediminicola]